MLTILRGGLRGANKGHRDLEGKLHCAYCHGTRMKYDSQVGTHITRWLCLDAKNKPELHSRPYTIYDRSAIGDGYYGNIGKK